MVKTKNKIASIHIILDPCFAVMTEYEDGSITSTTQLDLETTLLFIRKTYDEVIDKEGIFKQE